MIVPTDVTAPCLPPAIELIAPTYTSDRVCFDSKGCEAYPCSVFSSGCVSVLENEIYPLQRMCFGCMEGLLATLVLIVLSNIDTSIAGYVGNGDNCTNAIIYNIDSSACSCGAEDGWYRTNCGSTDLRLCDSGASGFVSRTCNSDGQWMLAVSSCAGRCFLTQTFQSNRVKHVLTSMHLFRKQAFFPQILSQCFLIPTMGMQAMSRRWRMFALPIPATPMPKAVNNTTTQHAAIRIDFVVHVGLDMFLWETFA